MTNTVKKPVKRRQVMHSIGLDPDCDKWLTEQGRRGWKKNRAVMTLIRQEIARETGTDRVDNLTRIGLRTEDHTLRLRAMENQRAAMNYDAEYRAENRFLIVPHPSIAGEFVPAGYDQWVTMVDHFYEELIRADTGE